MNAKSNNTFAESPGFSRAGPYAGPEQGPCPPGTDSSEDNRLGDGADVAFSFTFRGALPAKKGIREGLCGRWSLCVGARAAGSFFRCCRNGWELACWKDRSRVWTGVWRRDCMKA